MKKHDAILFNFKDHLADLPDKMQQVEEIIDFTILYGDSYGEKIVTLIEEGIQTSKSIGFEAGEIICYLNLLFFQGRTQGNVLASKNSDSVSMLLEMLEKIKHDAKWYPLGLNLFAYYYWFNGEYERGFNMAFDGVKQGEKIQDTNLGWQYFALGVFYFDTKDFENSNLYYKKALDVFENHNLLYGIARAKTGIATVAIYTQKIDKAVPLLEFAAEIYRDLGHYSGLSRALNDMALIEKAKKNYKKAIELFNESIVLRKEIDHIQGLITSLTELGEIYLLKENYNEALEFFNSALSYSSEVKSKQKSMRLNKLLYDIYKKLNDIPLALQHFEEFYDLKTQLMGDEANNNIKRLQTKFEKEKSEKEAEIEKLKNVELKKAYEIIEQKNKDIHDSIMYASRIQRSLLPTEIFIERILINLRKKTNRNITHSI